MCVDAMLPIMLKGEGAPHCLKLILVKIIVKIHFMEFFDFDFLLTVGETAEYTVFAFLHIFKVGAVFSLNNGCTLYF